MRLIRRTYMLPMLATLAVLALGLGACGGDDEQATQGNTGTEADGSLTEVTMGVLPISAVAPIYMGIEKGFFEEEGLSITIETAPGGAAIVPSVVSGEFQFGFSNPVSLFLAGVKGLPIQIIANANSAATTESEIRSYVFAAKDGPIASLGDLPGSTVAVNTLKNTGPVLIRSALDKAGVDPSTIEFTEIPFPEMLTVLQEGKVDAIWLVEPFSTQAQQAGARPLIPPYYGTQPGIVTSVYFTSSTYAEEHPEIVDAWVRAMNRSNEYAADHPQEMRQAIGGYTEIPPDVLEQIALPNPSAELDIDSLALLAELSVKYGVLEQEPDLDTLVRQP